MNKTIVISGVTSGVGKAVSERFVDLNWQVYGLSRNLKKLSNLSETLGKNFIPIEVNLVESESVIRAFKKIESNIDVLVNNAASFILKEFDKSSYEDIDRIIDTNLKGSMYVTLEALKIMKHNTNPSRIVNIGSVASLHGIENQSIYCASKYGLNGFSEALNQEIIKDNISITTLFPGGIDTPLWNKNNPYPGKDTSSLLTTKDLVSMIEMITKLDSNVILKNMTMFPSNEWH
tara:strand:+ start:50 stop:748 length:699 start_codon:yes stop_codon:yes gene_type:complete